jgi:hypothetical protein
MILRAVLYLAVHVRGVCVRAHACMQTCLDVAYGAPRSINCAGNARLHALPYHQRIVLAPAAGCDRGGVARVGLERSHVQRRIALVQLLGCMAQTRAPSLRVDLLKLLLVR